MDRLADEIRAELGRFGPPAELADLVERWPAAVGTEIARQAWPARIARDGTVHVNTADSVWAFELGQRVDEIARRIGASRVRFAPGPLPAPPAEAPPATVMPGPDDERQAREIAASIEDEKLRESVQKAASFSLARARAGRLV
jgi:predicted nucleic acid-binding Zn ribbon protein